MASIQDQIKHQQPLGTNIANQKVNFNIERQMKHYQRKNDKKRFPPNKKQLANKRVLQRCKLNKIEPLQSQIHFNSNSHTYKKQCKNMNLIKGIALDVQKLNPNVKNIVNKQSPFIHKTTLIDYHPVGHSKREKLIKQSMKDTLYQMRQEQNRGNHQSNNQNLLGQNQNIEQLNPEIRQICEMKKK